MALFFMFSKNAQGYILAGPIRVKFRVFNIISSSPFNLKKDGRLVIRSDMIYPPFLGFKERHQKGHFQLYGIFYMPKRYGITSDPKRREKELKNEYFGFNSFKKERKFPNKDVAQKWENTKKNQHPGWPKISGPFYGYSHNYTKRKPQK